MQNAVKKGKAKGSLSVSDKIDRVVTNRVLALPIFALIMFLVYYISVTTIGTLLTDWTNDVFVAEIVQGNLQTWLDGVGCAGWLSGLIVDGIVGGCGAVLGFVPQMLVLFLMLAFLEACGYMARIAFVLDRVFRKFGLSGKSFIPMLIGVGCGVPGIMASRTIENERDRRMTIMTTTFIPCGAKVPFIAMIAGAIFGGSAWVSTSAYFIGMAAIIISGIMLKKTKMFAGDPAPFVMELPAYHWPTLGNVLRSMWERGWSFIKKAGTIILLSTIFVWFTTYFGWVDGTFRMLDESEIDSPEYAEANDLEWSDGQTLTAAIGQSYNLFTPLQLANYIATLVGNGEHYAAHLLKNVKTYNNSAVVYAYDKDPVNVVEMQDSTVEAIKTGMHDLTTGSLSTYFSKCVVSAGAKTGTAETGVTDANNGTFVCFAPYDDPQIAVAVVIEKGGAGAALAGTGGESSPAETAVDILNAYFSREEIGTAIIGENTLLN